MAEHRSTAWRWWDDYGAGITSAQDHRLAQVPSVDGRTCTLHWAAASVFRALAAAWLADHPGYRPLLVASGWRAHRWASRDQYEATLISRYGSVAAGRIYLGYRSAHETGLALDLGSPPPMRADRRFVQIQRESSIYRWLMSHAPQMGLRCYLPEPWHWEMPLSREAWEAQGPEG